MLTPSMSAITAKDTFLMYGLPSFMGFSLSQARGGHRRQIDITDVAV
jgi:hypothetical protein